MKISDVMTKAVACLAEDTSLKDVAKKMKEMDCGFFPINKPDSDHLSGVITDRDLTIRATARGLDPETTHVREVMSKQIEYCFADDPLDAATRVMQDKGVRRLVVLRGDDNRQICGVISIGDILRHNRVDLAGNAAKEIACQPA